MVDELARAIREARESHRQACQDYGNFKKIPQPGDLSDHIAAAVRAHLASDAVAERMAMTLFDELCPGVRMLPADMFLYKHMARAAIAAAMGGG